MNALHALLTREVITVAALQDIYDRFKSSPLFPETCLSELEQLDSDIAWRAAWLLRQLAREGQLDDSHLLRIAGMADGQTHWLARMILCQLFSIEKRSLRVRNLSYSFLVNCSADRRALVRAWAVTALAPFVDDLSYWPAINKILREARRDRSKAVQARLRHL